MEESVRWALMLVTVVANRVTWGRIVRIEEVKNKERVQPNGPSEEAPRRQRFFALTSRGSGEVTFSEVSGQ